MNLTLRAAWLEISSCAGGTPLRGWRITRVAANYPRIGHTDGNFDWAAPDEEVHADGIRLNLQLLDDRRFGSGFVYLRYGARA